jgi:adenylylsulfate kinase-like enzyme
VTEASGASFHVKHAVGSTGYEALLTGGRSGVGKSTVAWEVSAQLQDRSMAHCRIEGDFLDQAYPALAHLV